ncbi:MAG TPA: methyltransferase domain-containing protein [Vicinamibacterales bacterium]|nr:methyltransferase domain-containing protein [Vicinamibacterales bacterium]
MRVLLVACLLLFLATIARLGGPPLTPDSAPAPVSEAPASAGETALFSPGDLNILEGPDRDDWQQPEQVMDVLGISDGSRVADIGAGGGWFTIRLAHRVGPNGVVYAEDIQPLMIDAIRRRISRDDVKNVVPVLGTASDPRLPAGLNAVLIVDTYPQFRDPVALMRNIRESLVPHGRLGIVDFTPDGSGGPGPPLAERIDPRQVIRDVTAAGFTFRSHETFLRYQYMLAFEK